MVKAVYIHIPFCKNICSYCNFSKVYYDEQRATNYIKALKKEIQLSYNKEEISTIYIGGGTPSDLSIENLKELSQIIKLFKRSSNCSITFECNPDIEIEKLNFLKKMGINRLSFGIETTHPKYLEILGRTNDKKTIISKIKTCRNLGFTNINGDLMYAFSNEKISDLQKDLDFILSLDLEHISTYSLIIEEHTKLYLSNFTNCQEELDAKMYDYIQQTLIEKGYKHYEVSNFCKEGYESVHNMTYWQNEEYYGFGLGAAGYIGDIRYNNTKSFSNYLVGNYLYEKEFLDQQAKMSYEMILGLRTSNGINKKKFYEKFNIDIFNVFVLDDLINLNYIIEENEKIYIPHDKWYVMNHILERFVR